MAGGPAQDLLYDIIWFLTTPHIWKPVIMDLQEQADLDWAAVKLPCIATYLSGNETPTRDDVARWQRRVGDALKKAGFSKRPDQKLAQKAVRLVRHLAEPKGPAAHVLIYTVPKVCTTKQVKQMKLEPCLKGCREKSGYIQVQCAYVAFAQTRAKKIGAAAVLIPVFSEVDDIKSVWTKVEKRTKGRSIVALEFFDHGYHDQQEIGKDALIPPNRDLEAESDILPAELAERMCKGAVIRLHGCSIAPQKGRSLLAEHLASQLLYRGGDVFGAKKEVRHDVTNWRLYSEDLKSFGPYPPCVGPKVIESTINIIIKVCGRHKLSSSTIQRLP